jgi:hypothetical protein
MFTYLNFPFTRINEGFVDRFVGINEGQSAGTTEGETFSSNRSRREAKWRRQRWKREREREGGEGGNKTHKTMI